MPEQFWRLTFREFTIKHEAFARAEDRARSLMVSHAAMTGQFKKGDRAKLDRAANALKRYPVKSWLT